MINNSHIYGDKNSRRDSVVGNFVYNLHHAKQWDKKLFYAEFLVIPPMVAATFLGTVLPSWVVKGLEEQWEIDRYVLVICLIAAVMCVCNLIGQGLYTYIRSSSYTFHGFYMKKYADRKLDTDYDILEEQRYQEVAGNMHKVAYSGNSVDWALSSVPYFLIGICGAVLYGVLLGRESLVLPLLIMVSMAVSFWLLSVVRKMHAKYYEKLSIENRKMTYITRQTTESMAGKDIRIFGMLDWMLKKYDASMERMDQVFGTIHDWYFLRGVSDALAALLRDGLAYCYLLARLAGGELQIYEFVLYLGLVTGFSSYFETAIRQMMVFHSMSITISYVREFFEGKDRWNRGEGVGAEKLTQIQKSPVRLELRDVSFTYPGKETPTLSHINMTVQPGEKLALIGLNGAGKTTLVKLICGFYHPTEGQILINDIPVEQFEREEYYSLISVMFQDHVMLPISLDENITGCKKEEIDRKRLDQVLALSGFLKKYMSLPKKGDTLLGREIYDEATDFSGGEKQKLLFARALYKQAPLVILDEPTAALDPIAENQLYMSYGEAMKGRTSLYISHRLSSTRFCDRILVLEGGQILEEGTHQELLAAGGRYAELFEMQGKYYREQEEQKRLSELMGDVISKEGQERGGAFHE